MKDLCDDQSSYPSFQEASTVMRRFKVHLCGHGQVMEHCNLRSHPVCQATEDKRHGLERILPGYTYSSSHCLSKHVSLQMNQRERETGLSESRLQAEHTLLCGHTQLRHIWFLLHIIKNLHQLIVRGWGPGDRGRKSKLITFRNNREVVNFTQKSVLKCCWYNRSWN